MVYNTEHDLEGQVNDSSSACILKKNLSPEIISEALLQRIVKRQSCK